FGVPVAFVGVAGYALLLGVGLVGVQPRFSADRRVTLVLAALATMGFAFASYLTAIELFVLRAVCRWCVASAVIITAIWVLALGVTIKYHIVIIRADNKGEGGVLALMALVNGSRLARGLSPRRIMIVLGIFGSALLYADGALTPAISVLSAVEGLEVATPELASWVLPVTLVILVGLFLLQSRGTARIGAMFGPVMLVWFATLGVLGLSEIIRQPGVLAAVAAIIASQAVISGAFSLSRQAVQLGYSPRLRIEHTSSREIGQIYVPAVNWGLMLLTCVLVLGFRTSSNIAGAYGVALSTLMLMTTLMFYVMSREVWGWSFPRAAGVAGLFLWVDLLFFAANMLKIRYGGWVPLAIAAAIFLLMTSWRRGREILGKRMLEKTVPLKMLLADLAAEPPPDRRAASSAAPSSPACACRGSPARATRSSSAGRWP